MTKSFLRRCVIALVIFGGSQTLAATHRYVLSKGLENLCLQELSISSTDAEAEIDWNTSECQIKSIEGNQTVGLESTESVTFPKYFVSGYGETGCAVQYSFFEADASEDLEVIVVESSNQAHACWYDRQ